MKKKKKKKKLLDNQIEPKHHITSTEGFEDLILHDK